MSVWHAFELPTVRGEYVSTSNANAKSIWTDELRTLPGKYLEKMAKVRIRNEKILADDAKESLQDYREMLRHHRHELTGQPMRQEDDGTVDIIGDNIYIGDRAIMSANGQVSTPTPQPSPAGGIAKALLGTALALGALGGGAGAAMWGYSQLGDNESKDTVTTIENTEGFLLEFPE